MRVAYTGLKTPRILCQLVDKLYRLEPPPSQQTPSISDRLFLNSCRLSPPICSSNSSSCSSYYSSCLDECGEDTFTAATNYLAHLVAIITPTPLASTSKSRIFFFLLNPVTPNFLPDRLDSHMHFC
jgi:hypothetical protein